LKFPEYTRNALDVISANKFRAFLTTLGILIGTANLIMVVSLIDSTEKQIKDRFGRFGTRLIYLGIHKEVFGEDELSMIKKIEGVSCVCPSIWYLTIFKVGRKDKHIEIIGSSPETMYVENIEIEKGRFIIDSDVYNKRRVCIIERKLANKLFKGLSPIGEEMKIENIHFQIVGVTESKGFMKWWEDILYIPYTTLMEFSGQSYINHCGILVEEDEDLEACVQRIKRWFIKKYKEEDFHIETWEEMIREVKEGTNIINLIGLIISGLSLLIGGIGIMNVMLVSVRERTREIGIRKAVGATNRDIVIQFLIESITLSLVGGIVGTIIGIIGALIFSPLLDLPRSISISAIFVGFLVPSLVGLFFGVWPARQASRLDPICALRYE